MELGGLVIFIVRDICCLFYSLGRNKEKSPTKKCYAFLGNDSLTENINISSSITSSVTAAAVENDKVLPWNQDVKIWKKC